MSSFKSFLDSLYTGNTGMFWFYIILGVLALFFIVLIIITSIKSKKTDTKVVPETNKENPIDPNNNQIVPQSTNEDLNAKPVEKDIPLNAPYKSETINNINNNIIKEEPKTEIDPMTEKETPYYLEKEEVKPAVDFNDEEVFLSRKDNEEIIKPQEEVRLEPKMEPLAKDLKEPIIPNIDDKLTNDDISKPVFPEDTIKPEVKPIFPEETNSTFSPIFLDKKAETTLEPPKEEKQNTDLNIAFPTNDNKSITDLIKSNDDPKMFETIQLEKLDSKSPELTQTIELPKMKPLDLEKDLVAEKPVEEVKEPPKPVVLSNDDIKARLAKLKQKDAEAIKEHNMQQNDGLEDIMKTVGLDNESTKPLGK